MEVVNGEAKGLQIVESAKTGRVFPSTKMCSPTFSSNVAFGVKTISMLTNGLANAAYCCLKLAKVISLKRSFGHSWSTSPRVLLAVECEAKN